MEKAKPIQLRVAVIGAGAAGLAAARRLRDLGASSAVLQASSANGDSHADTAVRPAASLSVQVFEASDVVGGTWKYTEETSGSGASVHSSMYRDLRTNLPKEIMSFPDFPFPPNKASFVHHTVVQQYLEDYAQHFDLLPLIRFRSPVTDIRPIREGNRTPDWCRWRVTVNTDEVQDFDRVVVCNGHYSDPFSPEIPGLEHFKGKVMHSHDYRFPEPFSGKKVLVLGGGQSGRDIMVEISKHAKKVVFSHRSFDQARDEASQKPTFTFVEEQPPLSKVSSNGNCVFEDGHEDSFDVIILCTGYFFSFPFLKDPECGITVDEIKVVQPLYQHMININHPTMAFIGIPWKILPFPIFDLQARYIGALYTESFQLPSKQKMEEHRQKALAWLTGELGWPRRYLHMMGAIQWPYCEELAQEAGIEPLESFRQAMYTDTARLRGAYPVNYKDAVYHLREDGSFDVVEPKAT